MFGWLKKDPLEKLKNRRMALLKEGRELQRAGKIQEFAVKTAEAEAVLVEIDALSESKS